jgi:uncharacterized protein YqjF (DUF2071 family)
MRWLDLLFAHWPVEPEAIARLLPDVPGLEPELFGGRAWVGVVPFVMTDVSPRGIPAIPRFSTFPEVNVRTYVRYRDLTAVWFLSLDAASRPTVLGGRGVFHLPYHHAAMAARHHGEVVEYASRRTAIAASRVRFGATYRAVGGVVPAEPGSFDAWATDRPRLLAADRSGRLWRTEIRHGPWPLQPAEATLDARELAASSGVELPDEPPILRYSARLDVHGWLPVRA